MFKMLKEIYETGNVLDNLYKNEKEKLKRISEQFEKFSPSCVIFSGRGSSDNACIYGQYLFQSKLKKVTSSALGSLFAFYNSFPKLDKTMVVGVSQSGETDDVIEVLKKSLNENSFTIGLTNNINSTLAKLLKENAIYLNAGIEESVAATKTFISSIAVFYMFSKLINKEVIKIDELKNLLNFVISKENEIKEIAEKFLFVQDVIILGTGFNYSIALEGSLKLKETCYINAQGLSIIDFVHGPFAMLEPHIPVIIFAPNDETIEVSKKVIKRVKNVGSHILVVSDNKEVLKEGDFSIEILPTDKELYPFEMIMFMYLFSYYLSVSKKLNPDKPRFLNKISKI